MTPPAPGADPSGGAPDEASDGPADGRIAEGDRVLLVPAGARGADATEAHLVVAAGDPARVKGLGVVDPATLVGHPWGRPVQVGQRTLLPLSPRPVDAMRAAVRGPQIIGPMDAARILLEGGVRPGARVLEVGSGSGVLTIALAGAVAVGATAAGPGEAAGEGAGAEADAGADAGTGAAAGAGGGEVVSLDHRKDHQEIARRNVEAAGLGDVVTFVGGKAEAPPDDLLEAARAAPFDVLVLDVPNPDEAVPALAGAVAVGGSLVAYVPLVSQVEALRAVLDDGPWTAVRTLEQLERDWHVGDRGSRPEHRMLGHTGFLTFARRVADAGAKP